VFSYNAFMNHAFHTLASGKRLHYTTHGHPAKPAVFCVHGLTRNARDFDALALALSQDFYVVCWDVIGRGESDWADQATDYTVFNYAQQAIELLHALGLTQARAPHWVGTSMGGLIAMTAQLIAPNSFQKLVLNDVGPVIEAVALQRIARYIGTAPHFASRALAQDYAKVTFASFGAQTPQEWAALTDYYYLDNPDGSVRMHYDPQIAVATRQAVAGMNAESLSASEANLWASLKSLRQPCLVLRGVDSDLLSPATVQAMLACNPLIQGLTVPNCGHAPHLLDAFQTQSVKDFLL
jgi:pimeloyl-ACP methyl ester carboxylesterase